MEAQLVYMTTDSLAEARKIAEVLIGERLAACVNVIGGMRSIYHWRGKIEEGEEVVVIAKTRAALVEHLTERVRAVHSYDCPCIVALPITGGNPAFLDWIASETGGGA